MLVRGGAKAALARHSHGAFGHQVELDFIAARVDGVGAARQPQLAQAVVQLLIAVCIPIDKLMPLR